MQYPIYGGMQDYSYVNFGTYELTIEVGCVKDEPASALAGYWEDNRRALLAHLSLVRPRARARATAHSCSQAQYVIMGRVTPPTDADNEPWILAVPELGVERQAGPDGSFWLMLPPSDEPYVTTVISRRYGRVVYETTVRRALGIAFAPPCSPRVRDSTTRRPRRFPRRFI